MWNLDCCDYSMKYLTFLVELKLFDNTACNNRKNKK